MKLKKKKSLSESVTDVLKEEIRLCVSLAFKETGDPVYLVALSGGPDSVALAHAAKSLEKETGFLIRAVHLNHLLRGKESERDERFVRKFCKAHSIPLIVEKRDVRDLSRKSRLNLEKAGREARLGVFKKAAQAFSANGVLTAHTRDDQLETVLMHLFRGSGLQGTGGMKKVSIHKDLLLIRPFLCVSKKMILDYLKENRLKYVEDSSNRNTSFTRNRIRLRVVPFLEKELGNVTGKVLDFADICRDFNDFFLQQEKRFFGRFVTFQAGRLHISLKIFQKYPFYVNSYVIRRALEKHYELPLLPDKKTLEKKLRSALRAHPGKILEISAHFAFLRERNDICVIRKSDLSETGSIRVSLEKGKKAHVKFFLWTIDLKPVPHARASRKKKTFFQKLFLRDVLSGNAFTWSACLKLPQKRCPLTVRSFRSGDRIIYAGRRARHTKKVKNLFIDAKIPLFLKKRIPVIEYGRSIICIPGLYVHPDYKAVHKDKDVWCLEAEAK
ncbi:MAG: tRNA lysidine(34) synthetase TilS [Candidatus Aureabacteria bacterium]|nr:tRNA lysidine(34) synthetase TilS [Candidatus Auribacterota bacterium]